MKGGTSDMSYQDEFFTPDEVDEQIRRVSQHQAGEQADAEAMAYLRGLYKNSAGQEQRTLDRMWNRIAGAAPSLQSTQNESAKGTIIPMQTHQNQTQYSNQPAPRRRRSLAQRLGVLAAAVFLVLLVGSMAFVFYSVRHQPNSPASSPTPTHHISPTPVHHTTPTSAPTTVPVPLKVIAVTMAVNPTSIAGMTCGTNVTVTYTARFYVTPNNTGGVVKFTYTIDNGRGDTPASLTFDKGQTLGTYSFQWSGALPIDHTMPEPGGVMVTSPNAVSSPLLGPTGTCSPAAFNVTSVTMSVSPTSIAGLKCGTNVTVTYTATFHIAPDGNGGTIRLMYTVNNGRGSTPASLTVAPGNTIATYSFTWSGALPIDHTMPEPGGVQVTSPNSLTSTLIGPTGQCS
jgi:hypothetical protein